MKQENLYITDCIRTFTGEYVNVFDPDPETIKIEDISHSLSMQCRFGGHLRSFYSVAQHCLNCSYIISREYLQLGALLHDASEAYLLDIPRPIKQRLPDYKKIEDNLMVVIAKKFRFDYPLHDEIKKVDEFYLKSEWIHLVINDYPYMMNAKDIDATEQQFLRRFNELNG